MGMTDIQEQGLRRHAGPIESYASGLDMRRLSLSERTGLEAAILHERARIDQENSDAAKWSTDSRQQRRRRLCTRPT